MLSRNQVVVGTDDVGWLLVSPPATALRAQSEADAKMRANRDGIVSRVAPGELLSLLVTISIAYLYHRILVFVRTESRVAAHSAGPWPCAHRMRHAPPRHAHTGDRPGLFAAVALTPDGRVGGQTASTHSHTDCRPHSGRAPCVACGRPSSMRAGRGGAPWGASLALAGVRRTIFPLSH